MFNNRNHLFFMLLTSIILCSDADLGTASASDLIFGGQEVIPPHKYPWIVTLSTEGKGFYCSGVLISNQYVLTAAHCVDGNSTEVAGALKGQNNVRLSFGTGAHSKTSPVGTYQAENITINPEYVTEHGFDRIADIALVKLANHVQFSENVSSICLPNDTNLENPSSNSIIAGWGNTENGTASSILKEASVPIWLNEDCGTTLDNEYNVTLSESNICAGKKGTSSCFADSGGPLFVQSNQTYYLIGLTSWGPPTCGMQIPVVYTRISAFNSWIRENSDYADDKCGASGKQF